GVSLPSGTAAKLIVNATRFVTFGADDMQSSESHDCVMFRRALSMGFLELHRIVWVRAAKLAGVTRKEFWIATQQDVCATPRHIGRNRHSPFASGLRHNLRFALMLLGIQDVVGNALAFEHAAEAFRFFNGNGSHQSRTALLMKFS